MEKKDNYISPSKELWDGQGLIEQIEKDEWLDDGATIINCSPYYSSILSQRVAQAFSINSIIPLELPTAIQSQVYNMEEDRFQPFQSYLSWWMYKYIYPKEKYLFVSHIGHPSLLKVRANMNLKGEEGKFASLYRIAGSFLPDYYITEETNPRFSWERIK